MNKGENIGGFRNDLILNFFAQPFGRRDLPPLSAPKRINCRRFSLAPSEGVSGPGGRGTVLLASAQTTNSGSRSRRKTSR